MNSRSKGSALAGVPTGFGGPCGRSEAPIRLTGSVRWDVFLQAILILIVAAGRVVPQGTDGSRAGLDSGAEYRIVYDRVLPGGLSADPILVGNGRTVLLPSNDRFVTRLAIGTGETERIDLGLRPARYLAESWDGSLVAVTDRDTVLRLDSTGSVAVSADLPRTLAAESFRLSRDGILIAVGPRKILAQSGTGRTLWDLSLPGGAAGEPLETRSGAAALTGSEEWTLKLAGGGAIQFSAAGEARRVRNSADLEADPVEREAAGSDLSTSGMDASETARLPLQIPPEATVYRLGDGAVLVVARPDWRVTALERTTGTGANSSLGPRPSDGNDGPITTENGEVRDVADIPGEHPMAPYARNTFERPNRASREQLMNQLESRMAEARLGGLVATAEAVGIRLVAEPVERPMYQGRLVENNFPDLRIRALEFLGSLATPRAIQAIDSAIVRDPDPAVAAAAVRARARYPICRDGVLFQEVEARFLGTTGSAPRERIASAGVELAHIMGRQARPESQSMLMAFADANLPPAIRRRALEIARQLGRGRD